MDDTSKVYVCDKCLRAICWHGEMMCDEAVSAGIKVMIIGELRKLALEHEDNWTDEKMIAVYGDAERNFA